MSPSESYGLLSKMTFDLARQRSEVDRLWAAWQSSFFASLRVERKSPRLLVVEKQDGTDYYMCDCDQEKLILIPPGLVERMIVSPDKVDAGAGSGTESHDSLTMGANNERLQEVASDSKEPPSGGQNLQG